jgi:alkaline phosphatase D
VVASTSIPTPGTAPPTTAAVRLAADPFRLGVASGDPDDHSAVLWTRLVSGDPAAPLDGDVEVTWELAEDGSFGSIIDAGTVTASEVDGHSVHVLAQLAGPAVYRFRAGGFTSPTGTVAPTGTSSTLRLASASCQRFEDGFYAAHRDLTEWRPDLVVFLGDFIYEGAGRPVGPEIVRSHGSAEPVDLAGYRARYARYLGDANLRAARATCPWLVIWDDHEVANDYAGLQPSPPTDAATFGVRRALAYRAWWEHMPVRLPAPPPPPARQAGSSAFEDPVPYPIHRAVRWGELADITLLDGRQFRSDQACGGEVLSTKPACREASDPARTMLGGEQERWVVDTLAGSSATWTVLAQQTVMTDLRLANGAILNPDQWDGYAPARDRLLGAAREAERVVVLTGDIHLAAVGLLPGVGVEFVTTSIASRSKIPPEVIGLRGLFPDVVDLEVDHRGYTRHTIDAESWTAEYRTVDDVRRRRSAVSTWKTYRVDAGTRDVVTEV